MRSFRPFLYPALKDEGYVNFIKPLPTSRRKFQTPHKVYRFLMSMCAYPAVHPDKDYLKHFPGSQDEAIDF